MSKTCVVEHRKEEILSTWERLSREHFVAASEKSRAAVRDHLPQLLDALAAALKTENSEGAYELSRNHSRQRFSFGDYTLKQVLGEYVLMKEVVFDVVEREDPDFCRHFRLIDRFFSVATTVAAEEFAALREDQIRSVSNSLRATNRDLERFAAVAAHDLRSPVATITSFAELALEEFAGEPPGDEHPLVIIRKTSLRMISLIDQLLGYAKIGSTVIESRCFSLNEVVNEARQNLDQGLQAAAAAVMVDAPTLGELAGDRILFGQLFQNLFANSLKFRAKGRDLVIKVWGERRGDRVKVFVRDNGHGFDQEAARTIFEPFTKGHSDPSIEGSGLGLATVQRIVDVHGGTITARGFPDEGAEFIIEMPGERKCALPLY